MKNVCVLLEKDVGCLCEILLVGLCEGVHKECVKGGVRECTMRILL